MASLRYQALQIRYQLYIAAEMAILDGAQMYEIHGRRLQRGDLAEIADMIKYLEQELSKQARVDAGQGSRPMYGVIPRDV